MIVRRVVVWLHTALLCSVIFAGCSNEFRYTSPCDLPNAFQVGDVVGTWQVEYDDYLSADRPYPDGEPNRINGVERIALDADGTYTQTFSGSELNYQSAMNRWEFVQELDGPKLAMYGLKYFASGVENSDGPLHLSAQMVDVVRFREKYGYDMNPNLTVTYPDEGFIYLYPRICPQKFGLVQMVTGIGDPDSLAVHNPVFEKVND